MDQYLNWDGHHSITNKYSVYNTLKHRAQNVCLNQQLLEQEYQQIKTSLRLQTKMNYKLSLQYHNNPNPHRDTNNDIFILVPYSKVISRSFKKYIWESGSSGTLQGQQYSYGFTGWLLRTGTALSTKEVSSICTGVTTKDVQWNT